MKNNELMKYAQVISSDMLNEIKESALNKGISLSAEIALRLMVTFTDQDALGLNQLSEAILAKTFSHLDALSECKRNRQRWLYIYEMEKLRLFMGLEEHLPRHIKEHFTVIDVKEAVKQINEEMKNGK